MGSQPPKRGDESEDAPVVIAEKLRRAQNLVVKGLTVRDAAVRLNVGETAVYEVMRDG